MTALLESPVGTLDVSLLEERQAVQPPKCNDVGWLVPPRMHDECTKVAHWETLCMGCGDVFLRCEEHFAEEAAVSRDWAGLVFEHACGTLVYLAQYVRIGA